ncbi:hypothetical protein BH10ACI3_BH10ACI3_21580 [soil metagenome]
MQFDIRKVLKYLTIVGLVLTFACGANESILKSGKDTGNQPAAESDKVPIEKEIDAMRTAGFSFIYVLRRKDGGKMESEDRGVIRVNTTEANRRVAADDDKAFVVGSNFQISPKFMTALNGRFAVENYSPAPAVSSNINANTGK